MAEGQSLCLLKLVPRILLQVCCLSTSYTLARFGTYRNNVKRMVGWVTIPHYYKPIFNLLFFMCGKRQESTFFFFFFCTWISRAPFPPPSSPSHSNFKKVCLVPFSQFPLTPSGHPILAFGCSFQLQPSLYLEFLRLNE